MIKLTEEDITEESIRLEEARLREKARDVEELRSRLAELQEKLREAEEERACIANSLQWRRMMAEVEGDEEIAGITAAVTAALNEFRATLQPPVDYDEAVENIPYVYTDDYADFTPLESLFDDRLGLVLELVAGAGNRGAESRGRRHRRAMLMLLVLTLSLKQLADLESEAAGVAKEIEELVENVTAAWQQLLYTDSGLSVAEKSVWKEIAKTFLGEPYDTVA